MKIAIDKNFIYKLFLLSVMVGNTIAISFAKPLEMNPRSFSIPYRIFIIVLSVFIIYRERRNISFKNISLISLVGFWIFYIIKLIYSFNNYSFKQDVIILENEDIFRILFMNLLPGAALLCINYNKVDFKSITKYCLFILCGLLVVNYIYGYINLDHIFSTYYIMYGHIGASLFIISLFLLLFCKKDYKSYFLFFCLFLGLFNVIQSMARSPLIAIAVSSFYMVLLKGNKKYLLYAITLLLLFVGLIFLHEQYGDSLITSLNRMYNWLAKGDTSSREPLYRGALEIFNSNPFVGGRILFEDGVHPHNIFLELLMATGILGLIIYFIKFLSVFQNASIFFNINKSNIYYKVIFALFLQYFTLVQTSCNLFNIPEFLYFSSIIIGISYTAKTKRIE
ncbi:O-antigen ligase-like membrane protein [Chryseobacterium sp. CBTAP 102]|uniref:O-antigen ligase family protein n=1 Tax=Chryseobacterium sp. CBTAP 102 TaxID=2135644 RepID=UPI000D758DCD|nr:O-antigen ligase family protein [Chryseobacterium sp. CBTAP 102]PXW15375.1 O-antigen ligase-like membrane protein [Chryseobacterium sp. CBTAP 102]